MKDCKYIPLKGEIDGQMPFYDCVVMGITQTTGNLANLRLRKVSGSRVLVALPKNKTLTTSSSVLLIEDSYYNLYEVTGDTLDATLDYSSTYDVLIIGASNLTQLNPAGGNTNLRFKDISYLIQNTRLSVFSGANTTAVIDLVGNLEDISKSPNLSNVSISNSTIKGRLECFAEDGWAAGRRSGTITLEFVGGFGRTLNEANTANNASYSAKFYSDRVEYLSGTTVVATYNGTTWTYA